jgi:hypothetical protein|tara:strand:- start:222 stop:467 length:246 start_codon:yes stop_codon:yes gene_type:complete
MVNCGASSGIPYPENSTTERSAERKILKNSINYSKCTAARTNCGRMNFISAMNKHGNTKNVSDSSDYTRYKKLMSNKIMQK